MTTLVFGSQDTNHDQASLRGLRELLLKRLDLQWLLKCLIDLPNVWTDFANQQTELNLARSSSNLQAFTTFLKTGQAIESDATSHNILATPLTVATQLVQYVDLVQKQSPKVNDNDSLATCFDGKVQIAGLCTGLICAAAVASSSTLSALDRNGSAALRLAMIIGGLVDAHDDRSWKSIALKWSSTGSDQDISSLLASTPSAYLSVKGDDAQATVTVDGEHVETLITQAKSASFNALDFGLRGAFHNSSNAHLAQAISRYVRMERDVSLEAPSRTAFPIWDATGTDYLPGAEVQSHVIASILTEQADWQRLLSSLDKTSGRGTGTVIYFGARRSIPQALSRRTGTSLLHASDVGDEPLFNSNSGEDGVAVIGMACNVPGGSSLGEFWETIRAGRTQHTEVPGSRMDFQTAWRKADPDRKWYANFIQDPDAFDHKFFKKSGVEVASMDPQQRLIMQVAYQALEQAGYFNMRERDLTTSCFIGIGTQDYETNVACHPPTAYTATGNLRSFAAGKISHQFGWSGPSLTIDTACSSSAVAIHYACKAILAGDTEAALAGGTNVMTGPEWFQNLAGASFLSTTGQCKPFDEKADGYCRGEGAGALYLKKLSAAVRDGDQILGVIKSSFVNQNENCSAITAPSSRSLSDVFRSVVKQAGLRPEHVSVVEAHGTGTQVGDKAEYQAIRQVFGGKIKQNLQLGSVKGLIGHLESASGIAAVIKTLLMVHHGSIPPQASHDSINPKLEASTSDKIGISSSLQAWTAEYKAALVNNYGASGSNASLIVAQAPTGFETIRQTTDVSTGTTNKAPFWLCGVDDRALHAYCAALAEFVRANHGADKRLSLDNLAFQLSRQSNRTLGKAIYFSCATVEDLLQRLAACSNGSSSILPVSRPKDSAKPVILAFGGQTGKIIGIDRGLVSRAGSLKHHLDRCDAICESLGLDSIYPAIFDKVAIEGVVRLQTALFAVQYATAMTWIDSGVQVDAVVGHSFGELTALCVTGVLSVNDAIELISRRARLIETLWGADGGSMLLLDGQLEDVRNVLAETKTTATIACYNGPRSYTIAGTTDEIAQLHEDIKANYSTMRSKWLDVSHAFHSRLVDPLIGELSKICGDLVLREPIIHIERATRDPKSPAIEPEYAASHMRDPVYFDHAVRRLAQRWPDAIWLEAGHNSGVTTMAARALGTSNASYFQAINLSNVDHLADATVNLWKEGLDISFWLHHQRCTAHYQPMLLPPYQFEKARHWLERSNPVRIEGSPVVRTSVNSLSLWSFNGWTDSSETQAEFTINQDYPEYKKHLSAHTIARAAAICPTAFQQAIATRAILSLVQASDGEELDAEVFDMESHVPICADPSKKFLLTASRASRQSSSWDWRISSTSIAGHTTVTHHVSGGVLVQNAKSPTRLQSFAKYERLVDRSRASTLLNTAEAAQVIRGVRNIYRSFDKYAHYTSDEYKRLETVASHGNESAARILAQGSGQTNVGLADTFCQVAGLHLNCMENTDEEQMYLCNKVDRWIRSPSVSADAPGAWEVYARHHAPSDKVNVSDLFVFDAQTGRLAWVVIGLHFTKVSYAGMARLLVNSLPAGAAQTQVASSSPPAAAPSILPVKAAATGYSAPPKPTSKPERLDTTENDARELLCSLLGLESEDVKLDSDLLALGVDSLLAMELAREVERKIKALLEIDDLMSLTDFRSLVECIKAKLGISGQDDEALQGSTPHTNGHHDHNVPLSLTNGHRTPLEDHGQVSPSHKIVSAKTVADSFIDCKDLTDQFIEQNGLSNFSSSVLPQQNEMINIHIVDAFEQLGVSIRHAQAGSEISRVPHAPRHDQIVTILYDLLVRARILQVDHESGVISRSSEPLNPMSAAELHARLLADSAEHSYDHDLTYMVGCRLADYLTDKADVIQLLFGSPEGRELVSNSYAKSPVHVALIKQLAYFWKTLTSRLVDGHGMINVLELGAGTGGTTSSILPILAASGVPITYTVTDISSGLVAGLRKRFGKQYPFVKFEAVNMENGISSKLLRSQHAVLATNCVHATRDLDNTLSNIHDLLTADGFLIMLEMTEVLPWVDLVFGLCEGWWLFDDGRKHACIKPIEWKKILERNGFGRVDWTAGNLPESSIQQLILAQTSAPSQDLVAIAPSITVQPSADQIARQAIVESYVDRYTKSFVTSKWPAEKRRQLSLGSCVLLTGATGSLGCHLAAWLAAQPQIDKVFCLNRPGGDNPTDRQMKALASWGLLQKDDAARSKLLVLESDSSKPRLGLDSALYGKLTSCVSGIVHNAWPMSFTRALKVFEPQLKTMANLIELASSCADFRESKFVFQFISSVAVVGHHPFATGQSFVPEQQMSAQSALPMGYADAKLICEAMLDKTLGSRASSRGFRAMSIRLGQIAGSRRTGQWNSVEHVAQLCKSSQSLNILPHLPGDLSWCPVDDVAATIGELHLNESADHRVYHIENPIRQPWHDAVLILANALGIPAANIESYQKWVQKVCNNDDGLPASQNPAAKLKSFWEADFIRMSCGASVGGLVLETTHTKEHSSTFRSLEALDEALILKYIRAWQTSGFLQPSSKKQM